MLRDEILATDDAVIVPCPIPEWGKAGKNIFIRSMTGDQRDAWEQMCLAKDGAQKDKLRASLACFTVCDGGGALVFTPADISLIGAKSAAALQRIFNKALKLNRLSKSDVDELEKNSEAGQSGASGSASPATSENQSVSANAPSVAVSSQSGSLTTA